MVLAKHINGEQVTVWRDALSTDPQPNEHKAKNYRQWCEFELVRLQGNFRRVIFWIEEKGKQIAIFKREVPNV